MIRFKTLNSTYLIDPIRKLTTRVEGTSTPTLRQGEDKRWKEFHSILLVIDAEHKPAFFFDWDGEGHGTVTSQIQDIEVLSNEDCFSPN